tara:strand:+ start:602 stop:769 length:168 start_codon:yes stop_codon:yes gene_type:complete
MIRRCAAILRERQEEIARDITLEHRKRLYEARPEVIRGAGFFVSDVSPLGTDLRI